MRIFGKKSEGGALDVIRCDEPEYLIWKWRPNGEANSTNKENAIRWGSSLRVKDGEVAIFVYKQESGLCQDYIEGPFDDTIKTANFPVLSSLIGLAFAGKSPFQAEVYFINLSGNIRVPFRVPYFDVADPRFLDFPVRIAVGGSYIFNITDYKSFIKLHRLINFELPQFTAMVRDSVIKYVKSVVSNSPQEHGLPVLQIERKILEINELVAPKIREAFVSDFGVNLLRLDISSLEVDKETQEYQQLREVTANLETEMRRMQNEISIKNLSDTQQINADNMSETLRIQREQAERLAALQAQSQFLSAHQINQQTSVLRAAAENLGAMGQMNLASGSDSGGGGFNPAGMMAGMAIGGAMGGQMANMVNTTGHAMQSTGQLPPPLPQISYFVAINGQNAGPFSISQLQDLIRGGQFGQSSYVWKSGMTNWELAGAVSELAPVFAMSSFQAPPPLPPQASNSGGNP